MKKRQFLARINGKLGKKIEFATKTIGLIGKIMNLVKNRYEKGVSTLFVHFLNVF